MTRSTEELEMLRQAAREGVSYCASAFADVPREQQDAVPRRSSEEVRAMTKFSDFMTELEREAEAEGPVAVAQLRDFRAHKFASDCTIEAALKA